MLEIVMFLSMTQHRNPFLKQPIFRLISNEKDACCHPPLVFWCRKQMKHNDTDVPNQSNLYSKLYSEKGRGFRFNRLGCLAVPCNHALG